MDEVTARYRAKLSCNFKQLDEAFVACIQDALALLSEEGIDDYLDGASLVCKIGRGFDPVLTYLEEMPAIAYKLGEGMFKRISQTVWKMSRTPNGRSIPVFLQVLPEVCHRLESEELVEHYIELIFDMMERTTGSIHGFHSTIPSPGLPKLLEQMPYLINQLALGGLKNWIEYGIRNYGKHPERQEEYFSLQSADSKAMLQHERHGTLFTHHERKLNLYLQACWEESEHLVPYSIDFRDLRAQQPYFDEYGMRIPDVFDDANGISGLDRYRAVLAHMAAHRRWSGKVIVDNFSPQQRIAIERFEDSRVEWLAMQEYPGLRRIFMALHPVPEEGECNVQTESCLRHRLAMLSYAILNPQHGYQHPQVNEFAQRFHARMLEGNATTADMVQLAISFVAKTRLQSDQLPRVYFNNTAIPYRDDNRHLWQFIEESDDEEFFDEQRQSSESQEVEGLPPRHYPEWDYNTQTYRPDWASVYESLHPSGDAGQIDQLLQKHAVLAKKLKQIVDLLKPQNYTRIRYQEEGSELDLDVAIRSLIDFKGGANPDPRINMSHKHDGRNIAVMLLLDLSASISEVPEGCSQSILELSQEAVSLLSWAIEALGDPFAIAGFASNTRHEVRYQHIKGFKEHWGDAVKARLAAMDAGYSTRMGAAVRHAAHYLENQQADKKLLLVLTDGEPSDIDVDDPQWLTQDTRQAVKELDQKGIYTYCISLDPRADEYVRDIFGKRYTVIDNVQRLPEKLPQVFMALTR
ncbi:VWA domain-containing protein [Candidatus Thiothrix sp. Deng01]|uniref:VWA domain-containing protein n=1 Tax=Candidatus Thiothrix phosphatis TaxID=3112415 RepID=A0ABU6CU20_9GAMM|nr:VWA domain-containing protein [Candidatus Thiothrix sp. Deng01]MEB4590320.1 VWA domain-containing protein [Candidatus Thiothrix sp. Deng01]